VFVVERVEHLAINADFTLIRDECAADETQ